MDGNLEMWDTSSGIGSMMMIAPKGDKWCKTFVLS